MPAVVAPVPTAVPESSSSLSRTEHEVDNEEQGTTVSSSSATAHSTSNVSHTVTSSVTSASSASHNGHVAEEEAPVSPTADSEPASAAPASDGGEWRGSEFVELVPLCHHVWSMATPDDDGRVDGGQLRPLMMMSGLEMDQLATIWGMVDTEQLGSVRRWWESEREKG